MLKRIKIKNFQSHTNTVIEFHTGLNCVIGSTHVGKSALVRSLRWVMFNTQFKDYTTWGENFCSVEVELMNGYKITREREKETNRYILEKDGKFERFEGFGLDIPKQIKDALSVSDIVLSENLEINLNVRSQHDPLFLLTDTGTIRAKALNSLVGIHIIDEALKTLVADNKKEKIDLSVYKNKVKQLEEEIKSFGDMSLKEKKVLELKNKLKNLKKLSSLWDKLDSFLMDERVFRSFVSEFESRKKSALVYDKDKMTELELLFEKYNNSLAILNLFDDFSKRYLRVVNKKKQVRIYNIDKIKQSEDLFVSYNSIYGTFTEIEHFSKKIKKHVGESTEIKKVVNDIKEDYVGGIKDLGRCPLCFSQIDNKKIEEIVVNL